MKKKYRIPDEKWDAKWKCIRCSLNQIGRNSKSIKAARKKLEDALAMVNSVQAGPGDVQTSSTNK